jgi:hypothetical protein
VDRASVQNPGVGAEAAVVPDLELARRVGVDPVGHPGVELATAEPGLGVRAVAPGAAARAAAAAQGRYRWAGDRLPQPAGQGLRAPDQQVRAVGADHEPAARAGRDFGGESGELEQLGGGGFGVGLAEHVRDQPVRARAGLQQAGVRAGDTAAGEGERHLQQVRLQLPPIRSRRYRRLDDRRCRGRSGPAPGVSGGRAVSARNGRTIVPARRAATCSAPGRSARRQASARSEAVR